MCDRATATDNGAPGEPSIVRPRVCEEGEHARTGSGRERGVDEYEVEVRVEGGAEVAGLGVEDGGGGAGAVEAEDRGPRLGRMHFS